MYSSLRMERDTRDYEGILMTTEEEDMFIALDSLLSLISHREHAGLSKQTIKDLDLVIPRLRWMTDNIIRNRP